MTIGHLWYADRPRGHGSPADLLDVPARRLAEALPQLFDAVSGALAGWRRIRRRRATIRELGKLDNRMLRDLGITRGDIWNVAETYSRDGASEGDRRGRRRGRW